uniref:Uncharacterized protein n=1 Tax=viral metagenome TaxID=1070528 RepID=A0A6C0BNB9_9ZZZZ
MSKIFIVGTGRTGTHWLARSLEQSGLSCSYEDWLTLSKDCAIYERKEQWPALLAALKSDRRRVCKCHVLLWLVEDLLKEFPDAKFIALRRDVEATLRSMLKKKSVKSWGQKYQDIPFPSKFLGAKYKTGYEHCNIQEKCSMRYWSHMAEINRLEHKLSPDCYMVVSYETLEHDIERLSKFLDMDLKLEPRKPAGKAHPARPKRAKTRGHRGRRKAECTRGGLCAPLRAGVPNARLPPRAPARSGLVPGYPETQTRVKVEAKLKNKIDPIESTSHEPSLPEASNEE